MTRDRLYCLLKNGECVYTGLHSIYTGIHSIGGIKVRFSVTKKFPKEKVARIDSI